MEDKNQYIEKMNNNLAELKKRKAELTSYMKECQNDSNKMDQLLDAYNSITKVLNMVALSFAISAVLTDMQEHPNDLADGVFVDNVSKKFKEADYIPNELKGFSEAYLKDILSGKLNPMEVIEEAKLVENTLLHITFKGI